MSHQNSTPPPPPPPTNLVTDPRAYRAFRRLPALTLPLAALAFALALTFTLLLAPLTAEAAAPGTPDSVTITRSDGSLTASWDAVGGATHYHVTYSTDGGSSWTLAAFDHATNSITFAVDNAKTYVVGVRAKNGDGGGGWRNSAPARAVHPADSARDALVRRRHAQRRDAHRVVGRRERRGLLPRHLLERRHAVVEPRRVRPPHEQHRHQRE